MSAPAVDYNDVQGLVRFGHGKLTEACFWLLNIRDASAARSWLAQAPVTTAVELSEAPKTALQVAFTREGLQMLGLPDDVLAGFSAEFVSGMSGEDSRSRRLGDVGASAPQYWQWGGPGKVPHVLVLLYAQPGQLDAWTHAIQGSAWDAAFTVLDCLPTSNLFGVEPFGFTDGISQPTLDWERQRSPHGDQLDYSNLLTLGEFLLGYPNEYGKYTDRPLLAANQPSSAILPPAEDVPDKRDLGRNGTYLVFRQLQQDVRGFWRFLDQQTNSDPPTRQNLAEHMVGRRMNGDPLLPLSDSTHRGNRPEGCVAKLVHLRGRPERHALSLRRSHSPRQSSQCRLACGLGWIARALTPHARFRQQEISRRHHGLDPLSSLTPPRARVWTRLVAGAGCR